MAGIVLVIAIQIAVVLFSNRAKSAGRERTDRIQTGLPSEPKKSHTNGASYVAAHEEEDRPKMRSHAKGSEDFNTGDNRDKVHLFNDEAAEGCSQLSPQNFHQQYNQTPLFERRCVDANDEQ